MDRRLLSVVCALALSAGSLAGTPSPAPVARRRPTEHPESEPCGGLCGAGACVERALAEMRGAPVVVEEARPEPTTYCCWTSYMQGPDHHDGDCTGRSSDPAAPPPSPAPTAELIPSARTQREAQARRDRKAAFRRRQLAGDG